MKIEKEKLSQALLKVKPALSNKPIIEQTDHFIFHGEFLSTYNDKISISFPFKTDFSAAVRADEFNKLISKISDKEIELIVDEAKLTIKTEKGEGEVVIQNEIKCPIIDIQIKNWIQLPGGFIPGIRFCSFSADKNMLQEELTCLWITKQYIFSSDNSRATKYILDEEVKNSFLLPASSASELVKYEPIEYILEDSWIHFKNNDGIIFSSRAIAGEYPQQIWDLFDKDGIEVEIPSDLIFGIDKAKIFADDGQTEDILLVAKNKKMNCCGYGKFGKWTEKFNINYDGEFTVTVSPDALKEILEYTRKMFVGESKLSFYEKNFHHSICLQ